jgi:hypothetical protein
MSIPLIQKRVGRNRFYGFRLPKSMSNDERWYKSNWFAGWSIVCSSILSAILLTAILLFQNEMKLTDIRLCSVGALVIPLVLSLVASGIYLQKLP